MHPKLTVPLSGEDGPGVIPVFLLTVDPEQKTFSARRSALGAEFTFYSLRLAESDVAVMVRNERDKIAIFYLSATREEEGRVVGWEFRLLKYLEPFWPEWKDYRLLITND
jgi:hypothetical protein